MVNSIDIKKLNLEELSGVVSLYPWFSAARAELCSRLGEAGACSDALLSESALYVPSRSKLYARVRGTAGTDCTDADVENLISRYISPEKPDKTGPRVVIAGSDFFSSEEYSSVASGGLNLDFRPGKGSADIPSDLPQQDDDLGIYSETLARIYLDQGYIEEARDIYSKLILRYPEKSVYFATLLEKIKSN